jgi:hypothetical protein
MEARDECCLRALQKHLYTVKLLIVDVTFPGFVETGSSSWMLLLTRPYCVVERLRLASAPDFV